MGTGSSGAFDSTSISRANTSISPVGRRSFTSSASRCFTSPSMRITHSERTVSADLEGWRIGVDHHLGDAVMVAQVDEEEAAVVAHAVHPAGQAHGRAGISGAKGGAGVGTIAVHDGAFPGTVARAFATLGPACQALHRPGGTLTPGLRGFFEGGMEGG